MQRKVNRTNNKKGKIHERRGFFLDYYRGEKTLEIREGEKESKLKTEAKLLMHYVLFSR